MFKRFLKKTGNRFIADSHKKRGAGLYFQYFIFFKPEFTFALNKYFSYTHPNKNFTLWRYNRYDF